MKNEYSSLMVSKPLKGLCAIMESVIVSLDMLRVGSGIIRITISVNCFLCCEYNVTNVTVSFLQHLYRY